MKLRKRDGDTLRRLVQPWQARSFLYYDLLGEIKFAAQFYSRALSTLRLYPAELDANGDLQETTNPKAVALLDRIQDPGGGRSGLLGSYGRLMFLAGECYLFVTIDEDTQAEQWEMLSTDELRVTGDNYERFGAPQLTATSFREPNDEKDGYAPLEDGKTAMAYRLWKRHPRYSMLADATMQGVLDLCEELVLLTQAVRSRARSRLAGAGVLFIDERISATPLEPIGDEDPAEDIFLVDLTTVMTASIVDEGAASAVVPMLVRVTVPEGVKMSDLVYHLQVTDPTQLYPETGLRKECIERIAIGLDMPPEILLGLQDSNHWSAWQVDEQVWKGHLQPVAQQLVDDLTASYFRPALRDEGVADWERYAIAYDATSVINHPDRTKDAKELYSLRAIGKAALREAAGFDDDDEPTEDELNEMIGVAVRDGSLAVYGIPSVRSGGIEPEAGELETSQGTSDAPATGGEVVPSAPKPPAESPDATVASLNGHGADRLLGAADLALLRAREAAGSRIRSLAKREPEVLALLEGVSPGQVAPTLGRERVRALGVPESELVMGVRGLLADALSMYGIEDKNGQLTSSLETHATRSLFDARPAPLPTAFTNYLVNLAARAK